MAFVLDDVDPTKAKYELLRFLAPIALLALSVGSLALVPTAFPVILVVTVVVLILLVGSMSHLSDFGLGRFSWVPTKAFVLSFTCGFIALAWEPAETWGGIFGLVFLLAALSGYFTAGVKLAVIAAKKSRAG